MSQGNEYNSLGQILAAGGEQAIAKAIFEGRSPDWISLMIDRRFGPLLESDKQRLGEIGSEIASAGEKVNNRSAIDRLKLADIPINSSLYGAESEGQRVRVIGVIDNEFGEPVIRVTLDFPDLPTEDEMRQAILDRGRDIIGMYPNRFKNAPEDLDELTMVEIVGIVRRF